MNGNSFSQPKYAFGDEVNIPMEFQNKLIGTMTTDVKLFIKTIDMVSDDTGITYLYGLTPELPQAYIHGKAVVTWYTERDLTPYFNSTQK